MVVDLKKKIFSKEPKFESLIMNVENYTMHNYYHELFEVELVGVMQKQTDQIFSYL